MTRGLLPVALACGLLAGCATPQDAITASSETPRSFTFVAESYDLYPTRRFEGEARRLQDLERYLEANGLCPNGYEIAERTESADRGSWFSRWFAGAIFRVTYKGACKA